MRIICSKANLLEGIQTVQGAIPSKPVMPVLSNILIDTAGERINLVATDTEVGIRTVVEGEIREGGGITIPARRVFDIVRELDDGADIDISAGAGGKIDITSGRAAFTLMGIPVEEYPSMPGPPAGTTPVFIDAEVLQDMLRKTRYATSQDETKYSLNGIYFVLREGKVKAVATDGKRLAYVENDLELPENFSFDGIIRTKGINELIRLIGKVEGGGPGKGVAFYGGERQVMFELDETLLFIRLVDGQFPNYEQVIPSDWVRRVKADTRVLTQVSKRIAIMADDVAASLKLQIRSDNRMTITTNTPGVGEAKEDMDINLEGEGLTIAYNPTYLLDALRNIDTPEVYLELSTELGPGTIRPVVEKEGGKNYLCVIMPMRVN
ncbi:MAG: DNA polymerase III subunit beta [bacterium]